MEDLTDRLPLVIGVTGHRDLREADVPRLETEIAGIIAGLRRDYLDDDKDTPIIVLSALAEGADRLVARVALAQGARLIAPLPMPLDEYKRDFEPGLQPGNMAEFDSLFAQAIAAPVMPLQASLETVRTDRQKRAEQYRAVGIFITQHCHVLLALWDGSDKEMSPGGSAEVVKYKREGVPLLVSGSPRASLDASEVGPVIEVVTPRMKETSVVDAISVRPWGKAVIRQFRGGLFHRALRSAASFIANLCRRELEDERAKLAPAERHELETWESFQALIELNRQFNADAAALMQAPNGAARVAKSLDSLFTDPPPGKAVDAAAERHALNVAPMWCRLFSIADTLAQKRQAEFRRDWLWLFAWGFVAFTLFALFTHVGIIDKVLLASYSLSIAVIIAIFLRARHRQHQERYLDYRALAEALRVAVHWKLLGIGSRYFDARSVGSDHPLIEVNPVGSIADAYPIKQSSELAWVKICLRTLECMDRPPGRPGQRIETATHDIARRFWVQGQLAYFRKAGLLHNRRAEWIEANATVLLVLSPFVLVPILLYFMLFPAEHRWGGIDLQHAIFVIVGLLPGVAAAMTGYGERLAFKAHARQYDRMRMLFQRADDLLPGEIDSNTTVLAQALYYELGVESMRENAEWVAIYRQRPIQPQ
jgi:hypothetical protein